MNAIVGLILEHHVTAETIPSLRMMLLARTWDGHEAGDLAAGRLAHHDAEENPDEAAAAFGVALASRKTA
jgi:hypothetical protein